MKTWMWVTALVGVGLAILLWAFPNFVSVGPLEIGWQEHVNDGLHLSVQTPGNWRVSGEGTVMLDDPASEQLEMEIRYEPLRQDTASLQVELERNLAELPDAGPVASTELIPGKTVYHTIEPGFEGSYLNVYVPYSETHYHMILFQVDKTVETLTEMERKILKSFRQR